MRTLARHLIEDRGHHHLTIDPAAANTRAITAYSKLGFQLVGILRQNERGSDGTFHDTLLMDLVKGRAAVSRGDAEPSDGATPNLLLERRCADPDRVAFLGGALRGGERSCGRRRAGGGGTGRGS